MPVVAKAWAFMSGTALQVRFIHWLLTALTSSALEN
jgi:hypothetical protein